MGVYDEIRFFCPSCGNEHVVQSKSGDCILEIYNFVSVPVSVSHDANRHAPFRCKCGCCWQFGNIPDMDDAMIHLTITKAESED